MQIIPQSVNLLDTDSLQLHKFSAQANTISQYGKSLSDSVDARGGTRRSALLLAIPSESLTQITAFLDPVSLFALGRTNRILHEHVTDDNTWHRAFACQFLGERPERSDLQQSILLRRCEGTWKREFVSRCNLLRRWERCRNGTVSHTPHYSPVEAIYLLSDRSYGPALLSVSLQYGVVARSFPLSGKVLKGFISASDGFGIGNGNPNAEFTPNVSSCAATTEGWTARVAFGFTNGEVALANVMRVMESGRTANRVVRCRVDEQHRGPVIDIVWDGIAFLTAGVDGEVRVWDAKRVRCVWVLQDQRNFVPDPCVHVLADLERGVVLAAKQSGTVVVWVGLSVIDEESEVDVKPSRIHIPAPATVADEAKEPSRLFMDHSVPSGQLCYGIQFKDDIHFFRVNINLVSGQYEVIRFGDGPLAPIQTIYPFLSFAKQGGRTIIFAGDALGSVSLFDWPAKPEPGKDEVSSFRRIDVASDGVGISAIACNPYVLAIGTGRGLTKVYDTLTLRLLHEFPSPIPRPNTGVTPVKEIILERDLLLVAVGERVLAWEAKPVRPNKLLMVAKKASAKGRNAKWHKRIELAQDINESRKAVEDAQSHERRSHERRRAHHAALAGLGLDENEALQYVLMLSRDEAAHQSHGHNQTQRDEAVFEAELEDVGDASSPSGSRSSSPLEEERSISDSSPILRPTSPTEGEVSPRPGPEPMETESVNENRGGVSIAGHRSAPPSLEDTQHFPAISSSASGSSSLPRPSPPTLSNSWSAHLKASVSLPSSSSPSSAVSVSTVPVAAATSIRRSVSGPQPSSSTSRPSLLSETLRLYGRGEAGSSYVVPKVKGGDSDEEEIDADLKLALELSLAEALSLKET